MKRAILVILPLFAVLAFCDLDSFRSPPDNILKLCQQVTYSDSSHFTSDELNRFKELTKDLSLPLLVETLRRLDLPNDDSRMIPSHLPGTPIEEKSHAWEAPADILIEKILAKEQDPEALHEIIFDQKIIARTAYKLIDQLGKNHPELACLVLEYHYQKLFPVWGEELLRGPYSFTESFFKAMNCRKDRYGMKLLEQDLFKKQPFAKRLRQKALIGILEASKNEDQLRQFIDWLYINSEQLPTVIESLIFRDLAPLFPINNDLRSRALIRLARQSPVATAQWAQQNTTILPEDWPLDIVNGWIHFWADHPDKIPSYENKWHDALSWLIENHPRYSERTAHALECLNLSVTPIWDHSAKRNVQVESFKVKLQQFSKH